MGCITKRIVNWSTYAMQLVSLVIVLLIFTCVTSSAQVSPKEGSKLHYRIIGFSVPRAENAASYEIEISGCNCYSEDSFNKSILVSAGGKENKIIAEVPSFGSQYTWRVKYVAKNGAKTKSRLYHFSTTSIPNVDTSNTRLRITKAANKYRDAYVFLDHARTLYDMNGHPVWYLPHLQAFKDENLNDVRDLKLSPYGTITFLIDQRVYEISYNGDILWKGPNNGMVSGKRTEHYHHEFTRLNNGHYMVLGTERVQWKVSATKDSSLLHNEKVTWDSARKELRQEIEFGTVIEYDAMGRVVWSWKSSEYFMKSDLSNRRTADGLFDIDTHENSFFFDEKTKVIYVSFKNISRILKIRFPSGKVLATYGEIYVPGKPFKGNMLFCYQHSCRESQSGDLYLFNNNSCDSGGVPTVLMIHESKTGQEKPEKIWEYICRVEDMPAKKETAATSAGGNVWELPHQSIFVSMCSVYSAVFIIDRDKNILWSAIPEKWNKTQNHWQGTDQYRASIINNRRQFERLIWGETIK